MNLCCTLLAAVDYKTIDAFLTFLKPEPKWLWLLSLVAGACWLACSLPGLLAPAKTAPALNRIPRNTAIGWTLTIVAYIWAAAWLHIMPIGFLEVAKPFLPILAGVAIIATCVFLDDLLACRAFGGILVLVPTPLLASAQWHPSPARYFVLVVAYLMAFAGMFLIAYPYWMRDAIDWATRSARRLRLCSLPGAIVGLVLVALAFVFR